ncbi:DEAD/DEAH box helicase [Thalassotalea marina]|uniref:RNA helicase n=1 Tax=Thalassotalea marina TaxID=1673741 RepID=A0A919BSE3_9GAMM|nr:DEAD/DEAH box helicase [Thalassotalea marina]GHG08264.1 RNA helicase [Thalassotalea marina]
MQFTDFGLDKRLMSAVEHLGFEQATQIQYEAIPLAMQGHDLIASSKTGSGKTLAFILPAMQRVSRNKALSKKDPRVLILTPTRELAKQVFGQLKMFTSGSSFKAVLILGGENFNDQVKALEKDPHFVVATPGRLADHLTKGHLYLQGLEMLILDEADRMLDLGFAKELNLINERADHRKRQTLMFSATLDHAQVNEFGKKLLKNPKRVAVGAAHTEHKDISKRFYLADDLVQKEALLEHIIEHESFQQMIIFTATRSDTDRLAQALAAKGQSTLALSGELSQAKRNQIMESFAKGQYKILVTTDLASRGLDLNQVSHVINFDLPKHCEEFVHRIGRTGRAGNKGDAISLVGPKDWWSYKNIEDFLQQSFTFSDIPSIKVSFKGLKPKKAASDKTKENEKVKKKSEPTKTQNKKVKKINFTQDAGELPVLKRKQAKPISEIDDSEQGS